MTCEELSTILSEGPITALPPELRVEVEQHLATCPGCRRLAETIDGIQRMPVPQSFFAPHEIVRVRPMPPRSWFVAIAIALPIFLAAMGVMWRGAFGWSALPAETATLYVILSAVALGALGIGFYRQFKPGARDIIDGRAAAGIVLIGVIAFAAVEFGWSPAEASSEAYWAWRCFTFGTLVALGTSLALLSWARLGFAPNPLSAAFWTGALASMAGIIALGIHCPNLELSHFLLGHASVVLVASLGVAWIGRSFFGLR